MTAESAGAPLWQLCLTEGTGIRAATAPQHRHPTLLQASSAEPHCLVRIVGAIDSDRLRQAVSSVVQTHPALRQRLVHTLAGPCLLTAEALRTAPSPGSLIAPDSVIATLLRQSDGSHLLSVNPSPGSVDETGLLRTFAAIATDYRGSPAPAETVPPETVDQFLDGLLTDPAAEMHRRHWQSSEPAFVAPEIARTLMLRPGPQKRLQVPVPLTPETQAALNATAVRLNVGVDAIVLAAWRATLLRAAPGEQGSLAIFAPGPVDQLGDVVGLLGRRVPLPVRSLDMGITVGIDAAIRICEQELREGREFGDFFSAAPANGWTVGFHHVAVPEFDLGSGVQATVLDVWAGAEPIDLDLRSRSHGEQTRLELLDATGAPDPARVDQLVRLLAALLERLAQRKNTTFAEALATPDRIRLQGNDRHIDGTLLTAFAAQTGRTPDVVAARDGRLELTYRDLSAEVERLSGFLTRFGVTAGDRVALCMSRRVHLLVAMLAVAHCGAAFVPLDPTFPAGRIADLLKDADPALVLADETAPQPLPGGWPVHFVGEDIPVSLDTGPARQDRTARPDDTAYVIYTSGSTGFPKGVPITHAALMNYLSWAAYRYSAADGSGTLVHSSIAVDMTVTSLFLPLLVGRTVTLLPSNEPTDLADQLRDSRDLSPLKVTPGGLRLLTTLLTSAEITNAVQHLVVGGEQLTRMALAGLDDSGLPVTNEYGPTETTVGCCAYTFRMGDTVPDPVPLGLPIWNTEVAVLTSDGTDVLPGTAGELVVSGVSVATGYLRPRPDLVERFTTAANGTRSYHTGDLVLVRPDGLLQMIGRIDDQLKIRGYRVEPSEVESALAEHPELAGVVVVATAGPADPVLTAFLVPRISCGDDFSEQISQLAADRLPFYARPDRYVLLDQLPLRPNGKVDRAQLETWQPSGEAQQPIDAGDPVTAVIVQLWQAILGTAPSSPGANFFSSGADSIKAVLLAGRAQRAGLRLTVHDILERPTLSGITAAARRSTQAATVAPAGPVPMTPHQRGALHRPGEPWRQWTLRWIADLPDDLRASDIEQALLATVREHAALRTVLTHDGNRWIARITDPTPPSIEVADLTGLPQQDSQRVLAATLERCEDRIDLAVSPVQAALIVDDQHRRRVAVVAHHLVCDVVSLQHITDRLRRAGEPALPAADDGYLPWLNQTGSLPETRFPGPFPAASHPQLHRSRLEARIARELFATHRGRGAAAAVAAIMLRAFADVRPDLPAAVCLELHGRDRAGTDLATTIGWLTHFTSLTPRAALLSDLPALTAAIHSELAAPARATDMSLPLVAVNYLGELSSSHPDLGHTDGPPALFPLEMVAWTQPDGLEIRWRYDSQFMPQTSVERLAHAFADHAAELATAALASPAMTSVVDVVDDADLQRITATFEG